MRTQELLEEAEVRCPYCGEPAEVDLEAFGPGAETYVEDCPVCCRPWTVRISREAGEAYVTLARDDD